MNKLTPRPGILDVSPYVGGESALPGISKVIKLASNEGALGPSPKAIEAFRNAAEAIHRYPDGGAIKLREALGVRFGLDPARIVCGNGSDELLVNLMRAYVGPGEEVIYSEHGFLIYPIAAVSVGAEPIAAPEKNLVTDVDALLARVNRKTRAVFIANPNNPTGTYLPAAEIRRLHAGLPSRVLLVLDGAYAEFVTKEDYDAGIALVDAADNVVMTRTFSKIFGLGALRLGWCYGSEAIVDVLNRIRMPFNISAPAQLAGVAALEDAPFTDQVREHTIRWREWTRDALRGLGIHVPDSVCNFVLARFDDAAGADAADAFLRSKGLIVRKMGSYRLPESLRITIGAEDEMRRLVAAMTEFVATLKPGYEPAFAREPQA